MIIVWAILAGVLGLLVGGVINALADDLPTRLKPEPEPEPDTMPELEAAIEAGVVPEPEAAPEADSVPEQVEELTDTSLARPNLRLPHYPDGTPRPVSAWLGVLAFVTGQRRPKGQPDASALSWRHPILEIVTALMFAGIVAGFPGERSIPTWLIYSAILILITVIDIEHKLILFSVILPSCVLAVLISIIAPLHDKPTEVFLLGGALGFGMFFMLFLGGLLFTIVTNGNEIAFGFGDVMLATLSGFMIGWQGFVIASVVTVFAGAAGALLYILVGMVVGRRYKMFTPLPYGPYIVFATLLLLLFREDVRDFLFSV